MQTILSCVNQIKQKTDFVPEIALVLGSGLGGFVDKLDVEAVIPYEEIDGFPRSTVEGHAGRFVFGTLGGAKLVVMQGRVHYYEGYPMKDVVLPVRVMRLLGAETVILTNAVGGINEEYRTGDFVAVRDHIASFVPSPLIGQNLPELGERFPDMSQIYDPTLQQLLLMIGKERGIPVHSGVMLQTTGPQYESAAEVAMYRKLGADTVSMSTAVEAIAAKHAGMRVCAINCVTNPAVGSGHAPLSHEEVQAAAKRSADHFATLLTELIRAIDR
ncbi:MAG: purine-nucleoside phosphorylase [Clostridia bacterium]|nr:purine-nucleoside phosphorylase [Clostridia bacterium]